MDMIWTIIEKLTSLMGPIATLGREKRELQDNALRAISHALHETQIYYAGLRRGNEIDREIEKQLSRYWSAAAIPLRHIDRDLAMLCEEKSNYWICPEEWRGDNVTKISIQLDNLADAYRRLIKPGYKRAAVVNRNEMFNDNL